MLIVMPLVKRMVPDHHSHVVGTYLDAVRIAFYAEIVESADAYLLAENCIGKKITKCIVADDSKVIDGVSHSEFEVSVIGKTIVAARRKGKNMWLQLDSPPFPSFQFGMAGAIYIKGVAIIKYKRSAVNDEDEWPSKYSKFFIQQDDGLEISFTDKRSKHHLFTCNKQ
ncbi:Formamidopyrimidine-DNA glycosylase [Lathyrus oleraceus]|uniref:Formamidopyrimidine-DNA glycosylase n=1 Tax=Pisum sativum TaxID=3888 RepID=A0A9D4Y362_PEA|nr:Formamidopyrimidine-DNA glycosylase [Pisum sativum]